LVKILKIGDSPPRYAFQKELVDVKALRCIDPRSSIGRQCTFGRTADGPRGSTL